VLGVGAPTTTRETSNENDRAAMVRPHLSQKRSHHFHRAQASPSTIGHAPFLCLGTGWSVWSTP
jgi:hypothetical protein